MTGAITMMLSGMLGVCLLMLILWVVHLATGNAGIVDAGWAGGLALLNICAGGCGIVFRSSVKYAGASDEIVSHFEGLFGSTASLPSPTGGGL